MYSYICVTIYISACNHFGKKIDLVLYHAFAYLNAGELHTIVSACMQPISCS